MIPHGTEEPLTHDYEVMAFCADAYLRYVRSLKSAMEDIEREVEEHARGIELAGFDPARCGGGRGASADKLPDGVIRLIELRERLSEEHARCAGDLAHARDLCRFDEDRRALWLSRVERLPYSEIARRMGCSKRTVRRMVAHGLASLYGLMPEEWRRYAVPNALPE